VLALLPQNQKQNNGVEPALGDMDPPATLPLNGKQSRRSSSGTIPTLLSSTANSGGRRSSRVVGGGGEIANDKLELLGTHRPQQQQQQLVPSVTLLSQRGKSSDNISNIVDHRSLNRRTSSIDITRSNFDTGDLLSSNGKNDKKLLLRSRNTSVLKTHLDEQRHSMELTTGRRGGRRESVTSSNGSTTLTPSSGSSRRVVSGTQVTSYAVPTFKDEGHKMQVIASDGRKSNSSSSSSSSSSRRRSNRNLEPPSSATKTTTDGLDIISRRNPVSSNLLKASSSRRRSSNLEPPSATRSSTKKYVENGLDVSTNSNPDGGESNRFRRRTSSTDDDDWMEQALLHGISTANKKTTNGPYHAPLTATTTASNHTYSNSLMSSTNKTITTDQNGFGARFMIPTKPATSSKDIMSNYSTNEMSERMVNSYLSHSSSSNHLINNKKDTPILPVIKVYRLIKDHPDEQMGLFLTKAKNGAVLVHSLAPDSPFLRITPDPICSGQEILSVNDKRINDPKMAARIIAHAKKHLSIRISTVKRERGFMYCQVKRKIDGGGGDIDAVGEANIATTARTARKRGSVVSITGLFHHGLRFITNSVDGTVAENGLVRVSHIDPDGLFGSSQNSNLRAGCIVLTVNGIPVTNGRAALDKVMSSRNLVEILHCDERVWRDIWVKEGLTQVMSSLTDIKSPFVWDLEWQTHNEEVVIRKVGSEGHSYAFRLEFNSSLGLCHAGLVDEFTMIPPSDEFDVPLLVQIVNHSQRTMMTMLMNMLHMANSDNIEWFPVSNVGVSTLPTLKGVSHPTDHIIEEMIKDEHGVVDKDLVLLAKSLMWEDSRSSFGNGELRHSQVPQSKAKLNIQQRRGSEGFSQMIDGLSSVEIVDQWRAERTEYSYENQQYDKRLREFSARQHKMDDFVASSDAGRLSTASGFSLFSNRLEIFAEDLEAETNNHKSDSVSKASVSINVDELSFSSPQSPRDNYLTQSTESIENVQQHQSATEKTESGMAFITGVFRDVTSKYEISGRIVGSGGFGEVRECYDKKTRKIYVVKSILKPDKSESTRVNLIRNEILLLHEANHENIVGLRDLFEDDKFVHIVMERCTGGDLFDRVVSENPRQIQSHAEAVKYEIRMADAMRSILKVLKYLHSKDIVHRDIKPEHFLLSTDDRETQKIKLIDFGLARKHKPGARPMKTFTGSPSFVAPEVIARRYDRMCDMFSVGVTAFFLLTGMLPFDGPTDDETFELISIGKFKFPSSFFLSNEAKDFITNLLMVDPKKRMSAEKALNHPWLLNGTASC